MAVCTEKNYTILNYEKQSAFCPVPTIQTVKERVVFFRNQEDENNIIGQYIIFCKVYNEQMKLYGRTRKTVTETIRICKGKNILREYLLDREKEVVSIMMSLFDEEEVIRSYIKSERYEAEQDKARKTAIRMIKAGKMSLEDIADYTELSLDLVKDLQSEIMQLA